MRNVTCEIQGKELIIKVRLDVPGQPSASRKNLVIASTEGNKQVGDVIVGLNVYRPA